MKREQLVHLLESQTPSEVRHAEVVKDIERRVRVEGQK